MRKVIQFAVNNPVTITMVVLGVLLLGIISYQRLGIDLLPNLNNPRLFVEITAGERPPEEIESQFVEGIESMAVRQRDVVQVSSIVKAGAAQITVEYAWNKDMDEAFLDLQKALNSMSSGLDELRISQHDPNMSPVVLVSMSNPGITDMSELRKVAESYVRNELIRIEGIADVQLSGDAITDLVIETDPYKLKAFNLTMDELASRIEGANRNLTGGRVSEYGVQYTVKGVGLLTEPVDFENLIVGYRRVDALEAGTQSTVQANGQVMAPVFLREVASVSFANKRVENIVRINGQRSIGLSIYKETRFNTVRAVNEVITQLENIKKALPGYKFEIIHNQGDFINSAIGEVRHTAILGIILAVFILFVFLRRVGTTLIISIAIPISIVATFNLMFFNDLTLNIMTLGGLALGAGMLVDNAIVVIENIVRNHESGMPVREAVITGSDEVSGAIISSTLTTIVVFLPIVYLHGASGELFKDQAWTVAFSLLSSLAVALLVIPTLYLRVYGGKKQKQINASTVQLKGYGRFVLRALDFRWPIILFSLALIAFAWAIVPSIGTEFMPRATSKSLNIAIQLPAGTRLERTMNVVETMEQLLKTTAGDSISVYSHVGPGSGSVNSVFEGENTALMRVRFFGDPATVDRVIATFSNFSQNIDGLQITFKQDDSALSSLLGTESAPVVVEIKGEELDQIKEITGLVMQKMDSITGLYNVSSSIEDGAPEVEILLDRTRTGMENLNLSSVVTQVQQQLSGRQAGQLEYTGEMRDIFIKVPEKDLSSLPGMVVRSGQQEYRLQEIAQLRNALAPGEILRRNQSRIAQVTANLDPAISLDKMARTIEAATAGIELPANYQISITGQEQQRKEAMSSLLFALLLSVVLVYMVMASQFESLLHPFTILLTIPLAVVGAILMFLFTGSTINIMGVIGIVMLVGIAVNNAIILVDRINQLKRSGMERSQAIAQGAQQRIRPILMTSLTTILALLPLALGVGESSELRSSMALAVIGGLFTSAALTLVVIPCAYDLMERLKLVFTRTSRQD